MTDPLIEEARRAAATPGPSMALRSARGYETMSRCAAVPDAAMLERHEYLTRQRGGLAGSGGDDLEMRRRELDLRRRQLELVRLQAG